MYSNRLRALLSVIMLTAFMVPQNATAQQPGIPTPTPSFVIPGGQGMEIHNPSEYFGQDYKEGWKYAMRDPTDEGKRDWYLLKDPKTGKYIIWEKPSDLLGNPFSIHKKEGVLSKEKTISDLRKLLELVASPEEVMNIDALIEKEMKDEYQALVNVLQVLLKSRVNASK